MYDPQSRFSAYFQMKNEGELKVKSGFSLSTLIDNSTWIYQLMEHSDLSEIQHVFLLQRTFSNRCKLYTLIIQKSR